MLFRSNVTSIFVTHDQEEAMEVASQVVVLNKGRIEQQGSPSDIYDFPANVFVSKFIGQTNEFELSHFTSEWFQRAGLPISDEASPNSVAHIRPHDIEIVKTENDTPVILKDWQHLGALIRIELTKQLPNGKRKAVFAEMPNAQFKNLQLNRGDKVDVKIRHAHWFH